MKFHENSSSERPVVPCGQKDRHDEFNVHVTVDPDKFL